MSQAAQAHDEWADLPTSRSRRREPVSWASAEDLEILGGLGEERVADWTVLTLERDDADGVAGDPSGLLTDPAAATTERMSLPAERDHARGLPRAIRPRRVSGTPRAASDRARLAAVPAFDDDDLAADAPHAEPDFFDRHGADTRQSVVVRGQATPMRVPATDRERRRPAPRARDRVSSRPDRVAFWAVLLGVLLILVAMSSAG